MFINVLVPNMVHCSCCWQPEYSTPTQHLHLHQWSVLNVTTKKTWLIIIWAWFYIKWATDLNQQVCGLRTLNITLQKSAQIVLDHCESPSVMIYLHHCWYLKSIQIISHSAKQLDLKKKMEWRFCSWKAWFIMEVFILHLVLSHQMELFGLMMA